MGAVGVGHHGVLAIDNHRVDRFAAFIQGSDFGDAFFCINRTAIKFCKFLLAIGIIHWLKAGIISRHRAGITCALNVVLPAHGIDACAFASEVPGHQRKITKALHIIHAANVLGDAECVKDRTAIRAAVQPCGFLDVSGVEPGDFGGPFGSKVFQVLKKFIGAFCAFGDERFIRQIFSGNYVRHAEQQRDIRAHT